MSVGSCIFNLVETRTNLIELRNMSQHECLVTAFRENNEVLLQSSQLVPGDVIKVPEGQRLPCEMILLRGYVICDESMLTGESTPIAKEGIPYTDQVFDIDIDKKATLFAGTHVIQTRGETKALVIKTGFDTAKGRLVRSILFPKPNKFKFYEDSFKFILVLFTFAILGFCIVIPLFISQGVQAIEIIDRSLDLITVTVPPALPAAMSFGTAFAIARLKTKKINCISPPRVNVAGKVSLFVFDKTGTLTEDGMNVYGIRTISQDHKFEPLLQEPSSLNEAFIKSQQDIFESEEIFLKNLLLENLATCHSIAEVKGQLIGDTQDLKMFEATNWVFEQPENERYDETIKFIVHPEYSQFQSIQQATPPIGVCRIFYFNSKIKRMGVIVKTLKESGKFRFHQKGAPEVVLGNCNPETVPSDLETVHGAYTKSGYRVLACAYKDLDFISDKYLNEVQLQQIEKNLTFLGLLILQNKLKEKSAQGIEVLHSANIRTIMATGDAVLTAIAVARECNIVPLNNQVHIGELDVDNNIK